MPAPKKSTAKPAAKPAANPIAKPIAKPAPDKPKSSDCNDALLNVDVAAKDGSIKAKAGKLADDIVSKCPPSITKGADKNTMKKAIESIPSKKPSSDDEEEEEPKEDED